MIAAVVGGKVGIAAATRSHRRSGPTPPATTLRGPAGLTAAATCASVTMVVGGIPWAGGEVTLDARKSPTTTLWQG
jgi:hypothetical protein